MTRDEMLALYRPIRASVRRILSAAVPACNHADLARAAKQLDLWAEGKIVLPEGDKPAEMLSDIALFEPNQRGRRAFDHFLSNAARRLDAGDCELAERMGKAFFSLFHLAARNGGGLARGSARWRPKPLAHGRDHGEVRANRADFRGATVRRRRIPRRVRNRGAAG